jgi:SNF2 family DNA or RNA helicase
VSRDNALEVVHDAMQPAIRFSRDECVDLPPCTYVTRHVELTKPQAKAYKEMLNKLQTEINSGEVTAVNEAVKAQKLIQIACGSLYGDDGDVLAVDAAPRMELVHEVIEECNNKVIVFVPFVSVVNTVSEYLRSKGITVECIYGAVSKRERDRIFNAFQRSSTPKVLVAQPAAMSHGLTLTAASTIIWYAPITSNDTFVQANGRITRPSQKNNQLIVMIEGTDMERRYYTRLSKKQSVQGTLLSMVRDTR